MSLSLVPPRRTLEATVTFLEMFRRPEGPRREPPAALGKIALLRAENPTVRFYRFLYEGVGKAYHWVERRRMSDAELGRIVQDPRIEILVAYVNGVPAGYVEVDARRAPKAVDIAYFGLMPEFIGKRLGDWLLRAGLDQAWSKNPERVTVNTNTLDHPRALPLYQRHGFVPYDRRQMFIEPMP